jgi:hypothetical protein
LLVGEPGEQIWGDDQHVKIGGQPLAGLGSLLGQVVVDPDDAPVRLGLGHLAGELQLPPTRSPVQLSEKPGRCGALLRVIMG